MSFKELLNTPVHELLGLAGPERILIGIMAFAVLGIIFVLCLGRIIPNILWSFLSEEEQREFLEKKRQNNLERELLKAESKQRISKDKH